jgi:opacity protein-like surface antigen
MQLFQITHWTLLIFLVSAGGSPVQAQGFYKGQGEVAGFAGGVFGIGSHAAFGGGASAAVSDRLLVNGEFTYIPAGESINVAGSSFTIGGRGMDFNGGIHYLFAEGSSAQPFASAGVGVIRGSAEAAGFSVSDSAFGFHVGGGLRYWLGERWGIRPELKIFFSDDTYARASVGLFFQFGE